MNGQYILVGKEPKPVDDLIEWAKSFEGQNRIVEQTQIGDVKVSTVFLGLDHSFGGGEPLLFETMIFGGKEDGFQDRYSTWDEAVEGHKKAVELVNAVV
jgi:hypothetical protein